MPKLFNEDGSLTQSGWIALVLGLAAIIGLFFGIAPILA